MVQGERVERASFFLGLPDPLLVIFWEAPVDPTLALERRRPGTPVRGTGLARSRRSWRLWLRLWVNGSTGTGSGVPFRWGGHGASGLPELSPPFAIQERRGLGYVLVLEVGVVVDAAFPLEILELDLVVRELGRVENAELLSNALNVPTVFGDLAGMGTVGRGEGTGTGSTVGWGV